MTLALWLIYIIPAFSFAAESAKRKDGVGYMLIGALAWPVWALWGLGTWMRKEME